MIKLSGKMTHGRRAYALVCPEIPGEAPEHVEYGWAPELARMALGWKLGRWLPRDTTTWTDAQRDEASAMIEAIRDPAIDAWGYRLVDAQHCVVRDAVWTLDLDDVTPYYDGPDTTDEYAIREWCERISDLSIKHVLVDLLADLDRKLTPDLVAQIHAQIDEEG